MKNATTDTYKISDLLRIMQCLRDPDSGCPWDIEQDFSSILPFTLEETYELVDAIENADFDQATEELGDLLFQVVFYCQLAAEQNLFSFDSVVDGIARKLIRRHPHVFLGGDKESQSDKSLSIEDVKKNWEQLKSEERSNKQLSKLMDDVPKALPALCRALKLQGRASKIGFDWVHVEDVVSKVEEELQELKFAINRYKQSAVEGELGDLLFTVVNLSRHLRVDAEIALRRSNQKFEDRLRFMEAASLEEGSTVETENLEVLEQRWRLAKQRFS